MTTTMSELSREELVAVPVGPESSLTVEPAFPDATDVIARVFAMNLERIAIMQGSVEFAEDLAEWSAFSFAVQAETLPEH